MNTKRKDTSKKKPEMKRKVYRVPESAYNAALAEIFRKETCQEIYNRKCHYRRFQNFNTNYRPLGLGNLMEAMKQAFEDRDWKQLYIFLTKAVSFKSHHFRQQCLEYLLLAMENDTEIDTTDLMEAFLAQCRNCKSDFQRDNFVKNTYLMAHGGDDEDDTDEEGELFKSEEEDLEETDMDLLELGIDINKL
ncbi:unnamed protein product [Diamesa hyperborea]